MTVDSLKLEEYDYYEEIEWYSIIACLHAYSTKNMIQLLTSLLYNTMALKQ